MQALQQENQNNVIQLQDLQRQVGGVGVIHGVTAQVQTGDIIALLGKNGAGKTTLLETILGFGLPAYGEAKLWGVNATEISGDIKQRIGFVPQQDELLPNLRGMEHIELFQTFRSHWNQSLVEQLVAEWMIPMELQTNRMSVGQRQKLSIVLALAHEPELLVLDEPVASLDPMARRQFLQQLIEIAADENRSIIFSTHIVSDVERVANQVWMLRDGRLAYQGQLDRLKETFVRVTIKRDEPLPVDLQLPNTVTQKVKVNQAVITLKHWRPAMQQEIANKFAAQVQVEYLNLEDIFLESNT